MDLQIIAAAAAIYGSLVPTTKYVADMPASGLLVYAMSRLEGISLKDFRIECTSPALRMASLCRDFAGFVSQAWHHRAMRPSAGKVGTSMRPRLGLLDAGLPCRFRAVTQRVLAGLPSIEALPWVITHGDIVPSNLMLHPSTGRLSGLVDWAEAEYLPFGVCWYGLEEILGEVTPEGFKYHHEADDMRRIFWRELMSKIPELAGSSPLLDAVLLSRDLGVLLWYGIAFDDGAIDRVVQEGRDVAEIARLDAFLSLDQGTPLASYPKI